MKRKGFRDREDPQIMLENLDAEICVLLARRMELLDKIAGQRVTEGLPPIDVEHERVILSHVGEIERSAGRTGERSNTRPATRTAGFSGVELGGERDDAEEVSVPEDPRAAHRRATARRISEIYALIIRKGHEQQTEAGSLVSPQTAHDADAPLNEPNSDGE